MSDNDLVFGEIEISGFLSYPPRRPQKINLNTNRLTAIIGNVLDGPGPGERNGAGKTAIIDAIQYLYFGRSSRLPNQGFVNYVQSGPLLVSGSARRAGISFYVQRGENPSVLRLFEKPTIDTRDWFEKDHKGNFLFEVTKSTKPETTKRIAELLGFDLKLTEVLLVNNPSDKSCYFLKTQEEQRDIQERIFGFTVFTEKAERLRELRKEENRNLATKESAFIATRQANDRVLAEITALEEKAVKWAGDRDRMAKFLAYQIKTYTGVDFEAEEKLLTTVGEIDTELSRVTHEVDLAQMTVNDVKRRFDQWLTKHNEEIVELNRITADLARADASAEIKIIRQRDHLRQQIGQLVNETNARKTAIERSSKMLEQGMMTAQRVSAQIAEVEENIVKLDAETCPTCGQHWSATQTHLEHCVEELEKLQAEYDKIGLQLEEQRTDLAAVKADNSKAETELRSLREQIEALPATQFATIEEATTASARYEELIRKHEDLCAAINPHTEGLGQEMERLAKLRAAAAKLRKKRDTQIAGVKTFHSLADLEEARRSFEANQLQFEQLQNSENPYRETIDNLRSNALKEVDETEVRELKSKIEHISLLVTLLSDKDSPLRRAVLNEWLPELNMRVNRYLERLELPHRMAFDANMSATFTDRGKTLVFNNLSAGQRLRAWLATNLAFREIFELINYRINLFFVDEVLDKGMSGRGAEVSYNLLNEMVREDKSVFLITHRSELTDMADHVLSVELQNGLSTISQMAA